MILLDFSKADVITTKSWTTSAGLAVSAAGAITVLCSTGLRLTTPLASFRNASGGFTRFLSPDYGKVSKQHCLARFFAFTG